MKLKYRQAPASYNGSLSDYVSVARLDHSTKHIFIVPGALLAYLLRGINTDHVILDIVLGLSAAACISSANYVLNEWLDREFDKFHPTKSQRSAVKRDLNPHLIYTEWLTFLAAGLICAYLASLTMFCICVIFALQGIVYNLSPIRTKNRPFLDVISEAVNNPIRLMIGWAMIDPMTLPPSSILLGYWLGGAFLMAAKRLSEYREITATQGIALLARYRASFAGYTEISLTVSCFTYALLSGFFIAIFLVKYRIEYIITLPVLTAVFAYYLALAMHPGSTAQNPEKLFREVDLMLLIGVLAALFLLATFVDIPLLESLAVQHYISLS